MNLQTVSVSVLSIRQQHAGASAVGVLELLTWRHSHGTKLFFDVQTSSQIISPVSGGVGGLAGLSKLKRTRKQTPMKIEFEPQSTIRPARARMRNNDCDIHIILLFVVEEQIRTLLHDDSLQVTELLDDILNCIAGDIGG